METRIRRITLFICSKWDNNRCHGCRRRKRGEDKVTGELGMFYKLNRLSDRPGDVRNRPFDCCARTRTCLPFPVGRELIISGSNNDSFCTLFGKYDPVIKFHCVALLLPLILFSSCVTWMGWVLESFVYFPFVLLDILDFFFFFSFIWRKWLKLTLFWFVWWFRVSHCSSSFGGEFRGIYGVLWLPGRI